MDNGRVRHTFGEPLQQKSKAPRRKVFGWIATATFLFLVPGAIYGATGPQSPLAQSSAPSQNAAPVSDQDLHAALAQVGSALNQVRIDSWKLSSQSKSQLRADAESIQSDMRVQLPSLFQAALVSPQALAPQWAVMQNVSALYNVLLRISTSANFSGRKADALLLGDALATLETARKAVSKRLLQESSVQDKLVGQLHIQQVESAKPKTIVVDNRTGRKSKAHKAQPQK